MKKLLLASLITSASFGVSATTAITFDDSSFTGVMGSTVLFDEIQFNNQPATVTQTDTDGLGSVFGTPDAFVEFGSTDALVWSLNDVSETINPAYEVFYDYTLSGTSEIVSFGPGFDFISVQFTAGESTSGLYLDTNVNSVLDIPNTELATFTVRNGSNCFINLASEVGNCDVAFDIDFAAGLFFDVDGNDLSTSTTSQIATLVVTVDDIGAFSADYNGGEADQTFEISHDGHITFDVPEPTSIAILGLGLLGFAGARRRKA